MENIKKVVILLLVLTVGTLIGFYSKPAKVEYKEKVVIKEVIKEIKDEKKNIRIIEEKRADGTIVKITEDKTETITQKEEKKEVEKKISYTEKNQAQWHISLSTKTDLNLLNYSKLNIERRILGNVFVGGFVVKDKSEINGGFTIGMEF